MKKRYLLQVMLVLGIIPICASAEGKGFELEALKGIESVSVSVKYHQLFGEISDDLVSSRELSFQTFVELELRKAGILVVDSATAKIIIVIDTWLLEEGQYGFHIDLSLMQWFSLLRDPNTKLYHQTWGFVVAGWQPDFEKVRLGLQDILNIFINDFLKANPK